MKPHRSSSLLFCLLLVLVATAAAAAGTAQNAIAAPAAPVAAIAGSTQAPAAAPAWNPAILAGLAAPSAPIEAKSETPLPFLQPSFCPPPCIGCLGTNRCTGPCQVHSGCTICLCQP